MMTRFITFRMAILTGVVLLTLPAGAQTPVEDPLTLFTKMMPVLSHDRCVNCHGATDPYKGDYHPGAIGPNDRCVTCHTVGARWELAPSAFAFFKRTTRQLCNHFEMLTIVDAPGNVVLHLEQDDRIGWAFVGRRGNAVPPQYTQKPPMTRAEFVQAYKTWVRDGGAICSAWEGTITRTETVATDTTPGIQANSNNVRIAGGTSMSAWQYGTHTYTITIKAGVVKVSTTLNGETNYKVEDQCSKSHLRVAYSLVGTSPPTGPDATGDTAAGPLVATGEGSVRVGLAPDGSYRIHVVPPAEKTQATSTTTTTSSCGARVPTTPANTDTFDWDPWVFDIAGKLSNPKIRTNLKGDSTFDAVSSDDPGFGLSFSADKAKLDGTSIKFRIKMTWDLSRVP